MSSGWSWCAGFVNGHSQDEVWEAIKKTIEGLTDHKVRAATFGTDIDPDFRFTAVSPGRDSWVGFWNCSSRFCSWVFVTQKLTGILGRAWIDGWYDDYSVGNLDRYEFRFFDEGVITDWFVLDPVRQFSDWGYEAVQDLLIPYFAVKLSEEEFAHTDYARAPGVVERHLDLFASRRMTDYRKPNISIGDVQELLNAKTLGDLCNSSHIISLPFYGPAFTIHLIACVMEKHYHNKDWQVWLLPILEKVALAERLDDWSELVTSLKPMWFECDDWRNFARSPNHLVIDTYY